MELKCKLIKKGEVIEERIPYYLNNNVLIFEWQNMLHKIDLEKKEFTRENDEYAFFLDFAKKQCEITLKKEKYYLQVQVEYANLLKEKNVIDLKYFIETDDDETEVYIELEGEKNDYKEN